MKVLVINTGSSSFKYQLLDMSTEQVLAAGLVERIGEKSGQMIHKVYPNTSQEGKYTITQSFSTHVEGMEAVVDELINPKHGVIHSVKDIYAIGHRVVMGGETMKHSAIINQHVKDIIRECAIFSPLHNLSHLAGIETAEKFFPGIPNVAVFDSEFHQTMPKVAYLYPLPYSIYEDYKIRRYGFHGTSHRYVAQQAADFLNRPLQKLNFITCHLGNGCSITAIKNGKSIDTSMGTTPLDGLMMGTRCGEIDPAIVPFLIEKTGKSAKEIDGLMNKESGLKGICGMNDMRDIHEACAQGNAKAQLALDMFVYRIKKYLGAYYAILGSLDGIIFTAGIGENDSIVREKVCSGLENLGIFFDNVRNNIPSSILRIISTDNSPIPIFVVPTNEELEIAKLTVQLISHTQ